MGICLLENSHHCRQNCSANFFLQRFLVLEESDLSDMAATDGGMQLTQRRLLLVATSTSIELKLNYNSSCTCARIMHVSLYRIYGAVPTTPIVK